MCTSAGLLVVSNVKQLQETLLSIAKHVRCVYLHLNVPERGQALPAPAWSSLISKIYNACASSAGNRDLNLSVLVAPLKGQPLPPLKSVQQIYADSQQAEVCERLRQAFQLPDKPVIVLGAHSSDIADHVNTTDLTTYNTVVLGGTFDRIHLGHKILLTQAVLRARRRLVVGVTTSKMIKSKVLPELILPVEERICRVREFLLEIDDTLQYEIVPIDDAFGPTQHDPDMDLIVVSSETLRGAQKINEIRAEKGLKALDIYTIDLVEQQVVSAAVHEPKISSSNARINMLGCRLRKVEPRPDLPAKPYIIGLTGGIAAGKSNLARQLAGLGAHVLECDKLAHELYAPGTACYDQIVNYFGHEIIRKGGEIDRARLGQIVFSQPTKLTDLNAIVWPAVMREVERRLTKLRALDSSEQPKVVVLEAALLLKAGWQRECHEIWSMIIPPEEAVRRVMKRNQLSEAEARKRVENMPSNSEFVAQSHIVFSAQWDYEFTAQQLERAWQALMADIL